MPNYKMLSIIRWSFLLFIINILRSLWILTIKGSFIFLWSHFYKLKLKLKFQKLCMCVIFRYKYIFIILYIIYLSGYYNARLKFLMELKPRPNRYLILISILRAKEISFHSLSTLMEVSIKSHDQSYSSEKGEVSPLLLIKKTF